MSYPIFTESTEHEVYTPDHGYTIEIVASNDRRDSYAGEYTYITYWSDFRGQDIILNIVETGDYLEDPWCFVEEVLDKVAHVERAEYVDCVKY